MDKKLIEKRAKVIGLRVAVDSPGWVLYASGAALQFLSKRSGALVLLSLQGLFHFVEEISWDGQQEQLDLFLTILFEELLDASDRRNCRDISYGSQSFKSVARSTGMLSGSVDMTAAIGQSRPQK